ncbi:MAG: hypothetical protein GXY03_15800 [Solirubrobacterales bacterium]|nr:hypothetical protein [Solirubrobacterales bacterium]
MSAHSPSLRRGRAERLAAWLVTGPAGHLYSVVADVAVFGGRHLAARLRGRGR